MLLQGLGTGFSEGSGGSGCGAEGWDVAAACNGPEASHPPCYPGAAQRAVVLRLLPTGRPQSPIKGQWGISTFLSSFPLLSANIILMIISFNGLFVVIMIHGVSNCM